MVTPTYKLNWKKQPVDHRDLKSLRHLAAPIALPSEFKLDRDIPIYDQSELGSCFHGDTEIRLLNGTVRTLKSLVNESESFWVYSCDENGQLVPGKATAILTGLNKDVIKITLDNGEEIICTPDHEFMLRDGSYKKAIELTNSDSLMPNNLNYDREYERYYDNFTNKWVYTHTRINDVINLNYKTEVASRIEEKDDKYLVTHHKNFNKFDNTPENLEWMGEKEHSNYHMTAWNGTDQQREHARKNAIWQHKNMPGWSNPSKGGLQAWKNAQNDPERLKQIFDSLDKGRTPEARKKSADTLRNTIQNRTETRKLEISNILKDSYKNSIKKQEASKESGKRIGGKLSNEYQCASLGSEVLYKFGELNENNWNLNRNSYTIQKQHTRTRNGKIQNYLYNYNRIPKFETAINIFGSFEDLYERSLNYNHKIAKIESSEPVDVYCLQVEKYHNFALSSGVFVHNCTANSACACFRYETAQVKNNFDFEPSRLFQYYNSRLLEGTENEDAGAYIRDAFKAMNKYGLSLEKTWPYIISKFAIKPPVEAYAEGLKNVTVKYATVNQSESQIKQTLLSGAAISFGFNVYDSFFGSWEHITGIMPLPKKTESLQGGHAVTIVGWSDTKKCFLIQNSWGENWGQKGLFWMPYSFLLNTNECDDFWCIEEVKIDDGQIPVPPTPSTLDWPTVANSLFKTSKELYAVKKTTLLRLGTALGVQGLDERKTFSYNFDLVKTFLKL